MKYFLSILMLLFLLPLPQIAYAEDIATAIKQSDPTKLKLIPYATSTVGWLPLKATPEGYLGVYDYSPGTTTSNIYYWDGTTWQKAKGNSSGYSYVKQDRYEDCLYTNFIETIATTTATVISAVGPAQYLVIKKIDYFNHSTTAGLVKFFWEDGTTACYTAGAVSGAIGAGFINATLYLKRQGGGLKVTTPGACGIFVQYEIW